MKFKSCAWWPTGTCSAIGDYSEDIHPTAEQANGVLGLLRAEGFGGRGVLPIKTEVQYVSESERDDVVINAAKAFGVPIKD